MKLLGPVILGSIIFAGCTSSVPSDSTAKGSFLCIPPEFKVSFPNDSASDDGSDPEGGGYGTSIFIEGATMAIAIPGYQALVQVGGSDRHQSLYVGLAPESHFQRSLSELRPTYRLEEHELLYAEEADSLTWEVIEDIDGKTNHWGTCADQFTETASFDCQRVLIINDVALTYTIDQANLHLYLEIDHFLQEKVDQWRCDASDIPISR